MRSEIDFQLYWAFTTLRSGVSIAGVGFDFFFLSLLSVRDLRHLRNKMM